MMEIKNNLFKVNNYIANNSKANNSKADNSKASNCNCKDDYERKMVYVRRMVIGKNAAEGVIPGFFIGAVYGMARPLDGNLLISVGKGVALGMIAGGVIGGIIGAIDYYMSEGYYREKYREKSLSDY
jgi:hypothetical protein